MSSEKQLDRCRNRIRHAPTWWLRRRHRQIVAIRPSPARDELEELVMIRNELQFRIEAGRRRLRKWWVL